MSNSNNITAEQVLRSGYNENRFGTATLTNASLTGDSITRPPGVMECCVVAALTVTAGTGSIRLVIEGSHDNTNFHVIAQSTTEQLLAVNGDVRALGEAAGSVVSLDRWTYVRVRAIEVSASSYAWSLGIFLTGIAHNGDPQLFTFTNVRSAAADTSDAQQRQIGARFATVQVATTALALGAASSISVELQGSPDGGTNWITMSDAVGVTGTGSVQMSQDGSSLIDMGHFNNFRIQTSDVGGTATSYTISLYLGVDSCDWFTAIPTGGLAGTSDAILDTLGVVEADDPTAEAANARSVTLRIRSLSGSPLAVQRTLTLHLSDTQRAGSSDLSTNATFSAVATGTAIAGLNTNSMTVRTDANGIATVTVLDTAVETVYLMVTTDGITNSNRFILASAEESAIAFA